MKAYLKDSIKKVIINKSRYISIILIIALGVGFFTGMNSIASDMQKTTEVYLKDSNVYDFQIIYNLGITNNDIEELKKLDNITNVEPAYVYDTLLETPQKKLVVRTNSITNNINKNNIIEGRNIENEEECLIDERLNSMYGYNIGDTIEIKSGTSEDIYETFNKTTFKIVGMIRNPAYLSKYYGTTNLENGDVVGLVMLDKNVYKLEQYNVVYAKSNINQELEKFSNEYKEKINKIKQKIEEVGKTRAALRYNEIYNEMSQKILDAKTKVTDAQNELNKNQTQLSNAKKEISKSYNALGKNYVSTIQHFENLNGNYYNELKDSIKNNYNIMYNKISKSNNELFENQNTFEDEKNKAIEDIKEANNKIENAKLELEALEKNWTIIGITDSEAFTALNNDLDKMGIMGKVFPVIFFIVATLVTITTMTRTIEEDRINIGTLKALGYSKFIIQLRYLIYATLTAIIGLSLGTYIGSYYITQILYAAYSSLYSLPSLIKELNWTYISISALIIFVSIILVVLIIVSKELKEKTANLLRAKSAKEGKGILLEKCNLLWKNLSFLYKISFRNIFRYKKRLFMTIIGIAGCTSLIYTGISLKTSIDSIGKKQFGEIRTYDIEINLKNEKTQSDLNDLKKYIQQNENVLSVTEVRQKNLEVQKENVSKKILYMVINSQEANDFIKMKNMHTNKSINLQEDGVVITEKLAQTLNVKVGDEISIVENSINLNKKVKITGVAENYLYNFMYLTPIMYNKIYGKEVECNQFLVNTSQMSQEQENELINYLKEDSNISSITLERLMNDEYQKSLKSLMSVVFMCIGCALILSFVVLFNLNNINIEERKRELATIKVLGFYDKETSSYVFRENIILSVLGIILGLGAGMIMLELIMKSAEVETILLSRKLNVSSFVYSASITLICTFITNMFMNKNIKKIDMIDSLKSVE